VSRKPLKLVISTPAHCLGCKSCELACSTGKLNKYTSNGQVNKRNTIPNIIVTESNDLKFPVYCRHCKDAYCLKLCPVKAIEDVEGVIKLNEDKCIGCGICQQACPYGAINMTSYNEDSKIKKVAVKCDMCIERQLSNESPLCYLACPTKALGLI
jgi:carbon-monoxide dehydrogenase iron sulfur subunit